jgi:DNA repair protein RadC
MYTEIAEFKKKAIKDWAPDDRPREKLYEHKPAALSNAELLAILIREGGRGRNALEVARQVLDNCGNNLQELNKYSVLDLMKIKGIGKAKAITIMAALELGRRRQTEIAPERHFIRNSRDSSDYARPKLMDHRHEVFAVMYLAQAGWVKAFEILSIGGITSTTVDQRLIFRRALEEGAVSIIVFHNHPSGSLRPSRADEQLTQKIDQAAKVMDIKLLDHVIVCNHGYFSFADEGLLR